MKTLFRCLLAIAFSVAAAGSGNAALVLSVAPGLSFVEGSGVQQINVFARSTTGLDAGTLSLGGFFTFDTATAGNFVDALVNGPPLSGFTSGPFNFSSAATLANINGAGTTSAIDPGNSRSALVSIDYTSAQLFTTTPSLLGSFSFDVGTLAVGNYNIVIDGVFATGPDVENSFGTLSITAIPEPSSVAFLATLGCIGLVGRRWKKRKLIGLSAAV